jgi:SpoVK/Ycf46/Vps4 family AAA+-type ATPase
VIGKRKNVESSVDQMLNAMQNIILQELEDFKGIFIATTNLINNLDQAIDRRILYKLKFETPNADTRFQILSSQFPSIDTAVLKEMADTYTLSGGQIQNIKKKYLVNTVLFNPSNEEEQFKKYILEETNFRAITRNSIGFKKSA